MNSKMIKCEDQKERSILKGKTTHWQLFKGKIKIFKWSEHVRNLNVLSFRKTKQKQTNEYFNPNIINEVW